MKNIFTLILAIIFTLPSFGQTYKGEVRVTCHEFEERNGRLYIDLDIDVSDIAMNKRQSWTITPEIVSADGNTVKSFPYVLINGKNKRQLYERKLRFENTELLNNMPYMTVNAEKKDRDTVLRYVMDIPFEQWMHSGDLVIRQVLTSCRDQQQLFLLTVDNFMDRQTYYTPQYEPMVSFIVPAADNVNSSAVIHYHLDRTDIDNSYMDNSAQMAEIREITQRVKDGEADDLKLYISGFASPEGPYQRNVRLSQERAEKLKDYVMRTFGIPADKFSTNSVPEDWNGLREMVTKSSLPQKNQILNIIDSSDAPDVKEQKIKAIDGGAPYRAILRDMLPYLRRAEYRVSYSLKDFSDEDFNSMLSKDPRNLNQKELFLMSQHYDMDSDQFNKIYNTILQNYPDDKTANNNAAAYLIQKGEYFSAMQHLSKAGNSPETWNNMGLYYMLNGDYQNAETYFKRAMNAGNTNAKYNLDELMRRRNN